MRAAVAMLVAAGTFGQPPVHVGESKRAAVGYVNVIAQGKERTLSQGSGAAAGKLGWSFDLTPNCQLAIVEDAHEAQPPNRARFELVLYEVLADGALKNRRVLRASDGGLVSPRFSPNGQKLAIIDDKNVFVIDLPSGKVSEMGDGRWSTWTEMGDLFIYSWRSGCSQVRRADAGAEGEVCGAGLGVPPVAGYPPKDFAVPVLGKLSDKVVGFVPGRERVERDLHVDTWTRGVACSKGISYWAADGGTFTVSVKDGMVDVSRGLACPLEGHDGTATYLKQQGCRPNDAVGSDKKTTP